MSCNWNPELGWVDENGNACSGFTPNNVGVSEYCRTHLYSMECINPMYTPGGGTPNVIGGGVIASPSTVWTGTGVYSRTLQAILSGLGVIRGVGTIPTATQFIQAPGQQVYGSGGYGNTAAGGNPGQNFSGQLQYIIETHPGYVAIALAIAGAFAVGALKKKPAYR